MKTILLLVVLAIGIYIAATALCSVKARSMSHASALIEVVDAS